jgi:hypothetical protein
MPSVYDKKVEELLNSGIRPIDIYTHPMYDISSGKPLALLFFDFITIYAGIIPRWI